MKDLMLDLETMDTTPNSVIVQVGACYFDRITGETDEGFLVNIKVSSCLKAGLDVSGDTIEWWFKQSNVSWLENLKPLYGSLRTLYNYAASCEWVWSHSTFDFPIIMNAYQKVKLDSPFHFRQARDLRTLVDLAGIPYKKSEDRKDQEDQHNALSDCKYQVKYAVECFNILAERQKG